MADGNDGTRGPLKFDPRSIGDSGLRQFGGFIAEEFLPELSGARGARTYREMADNDPMVGGVLYAIEMLLRQVAWSVQPAAEDEESAQAAAFVEDVLDDMTTPMSSVISEIVSMFTYGFAPLEIIWMRRDEGAVSTKGIKIADGRIGIRSLAIRAQVTIARWEIDREDGTIDGLWQQPWSGQQVFIPIEKLLLFRTTDAKNNPEGRSILRTAYRPWYYKKRIEAIEGIGVERDLAGLPIARIPGHYFDASASDAERATLNAWKQLVTRVRRDQQEGILIPSDRDASGNPLYEFSLLNSGGSRQLDTTRIVDRYNRAIATATLSDFILLGQNSVGSFALSSDKTALFAMALGGFLASIADVFNRHLMPRLWRLNGMDPVTMPKLVPSDIEKPNLGELGTFLQSMTSAGAMMFPDRPLENRLREIAGLPPAPEEGVDMDGGAPGFPGDDGGALDEEAPPDGGA